VNVPKIAPCALLDKLMVMYVLPTDGPTRRSGSPTPFGRVAGGYFAVDCVRKSYFFQFVPPVTQAMRNMSYNLINLCPSFPGGHHISTPQHVLTRPGGVSGNEWRFELVGLALSIFRKDLQLHDLGIRLFRGTETHRIRAVQIHWTYPLSPFTTHIFPSRKTQMTSSWTFSQCLRRALYISARAAPRKFSRSFHWRASNSHGQAEGEMETAECHGTHRPLQSTLAKNSNK